VRFEQSKKHNLPEAMMLEVRQSNSLSGYQLISAFMLKVKVPALPFASSRVRSRKLRSSISESVPGSHGAESKQAETQQPSSTLTKKSVHYFDQRLPVRVADVTPEARHLIPENRRSYPAFATGCKGTCTNSYGVVFPKITVRVVGKETFIGVDGSI